SVLFGTQFFELVDQVDITKKNTTTDLFLIFFVIEGVVEDLDLSTFDCLVHDNNWPNWFLEKDQCTVNDVLNHFQWCLTTSQGFHFCNFFVGQLGDGVFGSSQGRNGSGKFS